MASGLGANRIAGRSAAARRGCATERQSGRSHRRLPRVSCAGTPFAAGYFQSRRGAIQEGRLRCRYRTVHGGPGVGPFRVEHALQSRPRLLQGESNRKGRAGTGARACRTTRASSGDAVACRLPATAGRKCEGCRASRAGEHRWRRRARSGVLAGNCLHSQWRHPARKRAAGSHPARGRRRRSAADARFAEARRG